MHCSFSLDEDGDLSYFPALAEKPPIWPESYPLFTPSCPILITSCPSTMKSCQVFAQSLYVLKIPHLVMVVSSTYKRSCSMILWGPRYHRVHSHSAFHPLATMVHGVQPQSAMMVILLVMQGAIHHPVKHHTPTQPSPSLSLALGVRPTFLKSCPGCTCTTGFPAAKTESLTSKWTFWTLPKSRSVTVIPSIPQMQRTT